MHYKNGREAKNGDPVVMIDGNVLVCGILHHAVPGVKACNGSLRQMHGGDHYANLDLCLHADDINAATIPDSTIVVPAVEPAAASPNE